MSIDTIITQNIRNIVGKITSICGQSHFPTIVAVSKLQPIDKIVEAYNNGMLHFGENYVNELYEKSHLLANSCPRILWHFIGHLQTNKVKKLLDVPNLHVVETIDSAKLADRLNQCWNELPGRVPLNVMIQINTSGEAQKHGVSLDEYVNLYDHIVNECPGLKITGLMTIGNLERSLSSCENNDDFVKLSNCRKEICERYNIEESSLELSMGMTADYEDAIRCGSTNVRIGTAIFGSRSPNAV